MISEITRYLIDTPILTYHQITAETQPQDRWRLSVSAFQFERQMDYLHEHGYHALSLMELFPTPGKARRQKEKSVILTFDDGYENFYTHAYPIIRRHGFTATVFLITGQIGKRSDQEGETGVPYLNWDQVRSLHEDGITFGSHTRTHRRLCPLSDGEIRSEFVISKASLEDGLGVGIHLLAYPYGDSNFEIQKMATEAGYEAACGMAKGRSHRFNLWRTQCRSNDALLGFVARLSKWSRYTRWIKEETTIGRYLRMAKRKFRQ